MLMNVTRLIHGVLLFTALLPLPAQELPAVSTADIRSSTIHPDFELDPVPYFQHGYSGHAGIEWNHWRVEGEVLRTDVPEWVQGNKGFDVSYRGGGAKLQYFLSPNRKRTFLGMRTEFTRELVRLQHTNSGAKPLRHDFGIDAGYRLSLDRHFYLTPWAGADYTFDAHDLQLGGRTYRDNRFGIFAAVHLGFRF